MKLTNSEKIQTHVELAIAQNRHLIEAAAKDAAKAGVGVWVNVTFEADRIRVSAKPNVRVPAGQILIPDFTKFELRKDV